MKTLLNIGCGTSGTERMPAMFNDGSWKHVRVDIDPDVNPDVVASFSNLSMFEDNSADAIWSSHNLEHLPWHEVGIALQEAQRVLTPEGLLFVTLPDLEAVAQLVVEGQLMEIQYDSPAGPITPLDMLYGHSASQAEGAHHMAHRCGFTAKSLTYALMEAGFTDIKVTKGSSYDLWAVAATQSLTEQVLVEFLLCAT